MCIDFNVLFSGVMKISFKNMIDECWTSRPKRPGHALYTLVSLFVLLGFQSTANAAKEESDNQVKLVELFTSHGCSSCPAADRLLSEFMDNDPSLIALEFHVDYWNALVHGSDGNFVDPFSKAEYSARQRQYSEAALSGRPGVYTPQAIINGRTAVVGSNRAMMNKALSRSVAADLRIAFQDGGKSLEIAVSGNTEQERSLNGVDITLIRYIDSATTLVTGGENRNLELSNRNIVFDIRRLGEVDAQIMQYAVEPPSAGEGCVVVVQEGVASPVYAAARCP